MPGVTGGKTVLHRGSPGGLTTARWCFTGITWCPFTRSPPGGGFDGPPIPPLVPLFQQVLHRMDHLYLQIDQHQRMLDYSRQDLQSLGHLMEEVMNVSGVGWEDLGPGHQCGGTH